MLARLCKVCSSCASRVLDSAVGRCWANREIRKLLEWFIPAHLALTYVCARWAFAAPLDHSVDGTLGTLKDGFDRPRVEIADPTDQRVPTRLGARRITKADALDAPDNPNVRAASRLSVHAAARRR